MLSQTRKAELRSFIKEKKLVCSHAESILLSKQLNTLIRQLKYSSALCFKPLFPEEPSLELDGVDLCFPERINDRWEVRSVPSLIIVPGLAFSNNFERLGRGLGFYDKIISENKSSTTVGVCLEAQLLEEIPTEPHDMNVDYICTPARTISR